MVFAEFKIQFNFEQLFWDIEVEKAFAIKIPNITTKDKMK